MEGPEEDYHLKLYGKRARDFRYRDIEALYIPGIR